MLLLLLVVCWFGSACGILELPKVFGDHMVLQREPKQAVIWGKSGCKMVHVVHIWGQDKKKSKAYDAEVGPDRIWEVRLDAQPAGEGHQIVISEHCSNDQVVLNDVLFGDVLFCSGQSNMEFSVIMDYHGEKAISFSGKYKGIRMLTNDRLQSANEEFDIKPKTKTPWVLSAPENFSKDGFAYPSALCYFTARNLYTYFNQTVPIGVVGSYWGGQPVEKFSSADALNDKTCGGIVEDESQLFLYHHQQQTCVVNKEEEETKNGVLWNALIHPFLRMRFKSVLWYQGEGNSGDPNGYACRFPAMITDWRKKMNDEELPFFFVQLAGFLYQNFQHLRAAQMHALALPKTAFASAIDIGNQKDIHPRDKQTLSHRMALSILRVAYGVNDDKVRSIIGPTFAKAKLENDKTIRVAYMKGTAMNLKLQPTENCSTCCNGEDLPFVVAYHHEPSGEIKHAHATKVEFETTTNDALVTFDNLQDNDKITFQELQFAFEPFPQCVVSSDFGGYTGALPGTPFIVKLSHERNMVFVPITTF